MAKRAPQKLLYPLIALVVVIIVLSVLFVLLAQNRNNQRENDVKFLLNAIARLDAESNEVWSDTEIRDDIFTMLYHDQDMFISADEAALCKYLIPEFVNELPRDPKIEGGKPLNDCNSAYNTGYTLRVDGQGILTISSPHSELGKKISVSQNLSTIE